MIEDISILVEDHSPERTYFHVTYFKKQINDIITPGTWGKSMLDAASIHNNNIQQSPWVCEISLEYMRFLFFPEKPSRLLSSFAFTTIDGAQYFKETQRTKKDSYIYEVAVEAVLLPYHFGYYNSVFPGVSGDLPSSLLNGAAHNYWNDKSIEVGQPNFHVEFITRSPLKVIRKIVE